MRQRRRTLTVGVAVTLLALTACGSETDEGATIAQTSPAGTTPTATEPPVTEPPATEAVDTDPPATDAPETEDTDAAPPATVSSETDAAAAGANYGDPCDLLVGIDLDALLGEPVGAPVGELNDIADMCNAEVANEDSRGSLALSVSTNSAADNFANLEELYGVDAEIAGLGDQAFHSGPYVVVLAGDTLVNLQVLRDAALGFAVPDPDMEAATALILANLADG